MIDAEPCDIGLVGLAPSSIIDPVGHAAAGGEAAGGVPVAAAAGHGERALRGGDVLEVGQFLQERAQITCRQTTLEASPAERLRLLGAIERLQGRDARGFPDVLTDARTLRVNAVESQVTLRRDPGLVAY